MDASSMVMGICCKSATLDRMVKGSLRITRATIMIKKVPLMMSGGRLKQINMAIPITEPGII